MVISLFTFRNRHRIEVWCLVVFTLLFNRSVSADDSYFWTVQKLNDNKPWDRFVGAPRPIGVEGRISVSGSGQFRLQHCDLVFTMDKQKLPSVSTKTCVEVKGRFEKDGSRIVFAVENLKTVASYANQFDLRSSRIVRGSADDWYDLGDWMAERAKFYEDADLSKKASDAYMKGIELEASKRTDAEGRFAIARKMADYKLSDRRRMEFVHEGYRTQWQALQKSDPKEIAAWNEFASTIQRELPGTSEPLKMVAPDLKETYQQDPISAYRKGSDETRLQLHRLFLVAITRKILLRDESNDGHDGDLIAEQIDRLIPEEHALAEQQRMKRIEFGLKNIANATRSDVEHLAAALRERQQDESARQALADWIKTHESRLREDGVLGLVRLSDEYLALLNDRSTAVQYLMEASKIDPTLETIKTKLSSLGYQSHQGRWVKAELIPKDQNESSAQTVTGISLGMKASSLRTLLGQPRSLARVFTARGVTEIWSYGSPGSTPLVLRLEQSGGDTEPRVATLPEG